MPTPASVPMLLARALVLAGITTGFGSLAHVAAGGLLPGTFWMGYLFVTVLSVSALALRSEAPALRVVAILAAGQSVVHLFLSLTAGHRHVPGQPDHHGLDDLLAHGPMMAAHTLAAAVIGLWLAAGERALWDLITLALWKLLAFPAPLPLLVRRPAAPTHPPIARPHLALLDVSAPRRGPPVLLGA